VEGFAAAALERKKLRMPEDKTGIERFAWRIPFGAAALKILLESGGILRFPSLHC
jgi:hypothetical protein